MMMRLLAVMGALAGLIVVIGFFSIPGVVRRGVSARDEPTAIESLLARTLRDAAMPRTARELKNPLAMEAAQRTRSRDLWADNCAICHAADGSGHMAIAQTMYPRPPDMRAAPTQDLSDGELYWIIQNGIRLSGMPAWGDERADDVESWELVAFIRALPGLTSDDIEALRNAMPITAHERSQREAEEVF